MKRLLLPLLALVVMFRTYAQSEAPYYEIPAYPESYTPGTVAARMVDGLGYRFYWATEGLTAEDLAYKPSEDSRTTEETIDHIYGLSTTVINAAKKVPNGDVNREGMTWEDKRRATLENLKAASDLLLKTEDLSQHKVIFASEYPFWNMINGPIADAIYHTGQVVAFRRASGNPMNPKVSVFSGKNRD